MNLHKQNFVCWPSVGPQDIKQTYIHTYTIEFGKPSMASEQPVPRGIVSVAMPLTGLQGFATPQSCPTRHRGRRATAQAAGKLRSGMTFLFTPVLALTACFCQLEASWFKLTAQKSRDISDFVPLSNPTLKDFS